MKFEVKSKIECKRSETKPYSTEKLAYVFCCKRWLKRIGERTVVLYGLLSLIETMTVSW